MLVKKLKKKIIKLYQTRYGTSQISAVVNLSIPTILKYLKEEGIPIRNKKKLHLDKYDIDKAVELYAVGYKISYIEELTKLSSSTIHKYAKKAGIPLRRDWKCPKHEIKKAIRFYNEGFELSYITQKTNISISTLWKYLKKEKIPLRKEKKRSIENLKQQKIVDLYKEGFSLKYIKGVTKLNIHSIIKCLKAAGIPRRSRGGVCIDKEKIEKAIKIYKEGHSLQSCVQEVKISSITLFRYLKKAGIPTRGNGRRYIDKKKIQEAIESYKEGYSIKSSAKKIKISPITLSKYLKNAEIPIRKGNFVDKRELKGVLEFYKRDHSFRSVEKNPVIHENTILKYAKAVGVPIKKRGRKAVSKEEIEKVLELYKNGHTLKDIEQNTKLTVNTILRYVKASGIPRRNKKKKAIRKEDIEKAIILYEKGNSLRICAESINISSVTLLKYFKAEGIYFKRRRINNETVEKILELYKNGRPLKDIAKNTDLSVGTIVRYIRVSDLPRRGKGRRALDNMKLEKAVEIYKEGYSIQNSAQKVKISPITLFKYLKKTGIPRRRRSIDSMKLEDAIRLYKKGCSIKESAQITKINPATLSKYIKQTGMPIRKGKKGSAVTEEKLKKGLTMFEQGFSLKDCADNINMSAPALSRYIKKNGLVIKRKNWKIIDKEKVEKALQLYMEGYTLSYIRDTVNISKGSISKYVKIRGLPMRGKINN